MSWEAFQQSTGAKELSWFGLATFVRRMGDCKKV